MIECDYYKNYKGPNLVKAEIWQRNKQKVDVTEDIKKLYGKDNNWNGKLYLFEDVFLNKDYTTHFRVDFLSDDGQKHWFHGMVGQPKQYFNPPLASPYNQLRGLDKMLEKDLSIN